jgi:hypothetical protein
MASIQYASESFVSRLNAGLKEWSFDNEENYTRKENLNFLPEKFFGEFFDEEWRIERGRGGILLYVGGFVIHWNDDETGREMVNKELRTLIRAKIYEKHAEAIRAFGIQE